MSDDKAILTTRQGHPVRGNQSLRTVGERGPATLESDQFIEKSSDPTYVDGRLEATE